MTGVRRILRQRRLVRQQIRDTRLQTGTLDSADVGPDAT